jgi:hypothetical protein
VNVRTVMQTEISSHPSTVRKKKMSAIINPP